MTSERIIEVLELYERELQPIAAGYDGMQRLGLTGPASDRVYLKVKHLLEMIPKIRGFVSCDAETSPDRRNALREKAFRWLGFMQGALWALELHEIDELRRHNMPPDAPFVPDGSAQ